MSMLALTLACSAYAVRPHVLPIIPPAEDAAGIDSPEGPIAFIALDDAHDHFEKGTAIFADARPQQAFDTGHIRGALHLDPAEFDTWSLQIFAQVPADAMIIAYCDGVQCDLSHELAEKLIWLGYEKVAVLKNGWAQWQSHHFAVSGPADS